MTSDEHHFEGYFTCVVADNFDGRDITVQKKQHLELKTDILWY